jgi:peptidoglycan/LPS O-acetylase OafA/YrhL
MRRHLWVLGIAALAGVIASFLIVSDNYFLGAIMGAVAGMFVVLFVRAWPMDLDPRERNRMVITVKVDGKSTR